MQLSLHQLLAVVAGRSTCCCTQFCGTIEAMAQTYCVRSSGPAMSAAREAKGFWMTALVPAMVLARARTALAAAVNVRSLPRARSEAWDIWLPLSRKLDLTVIPQRTNRMGRFVRHVLAANLPRPTRYLEIGAFEGATLALVYTLLDCDVRITVIDPWDSYAELPEAQTRNAEQRFASNAAAIGADRVLRALKGRSIDHLPKLIEAGETFDFILIDGSHAALDVLADAALAWPLLVPGGLLVFDDYLYEARRDDRLFRPKLAIDAFIGTMRRELEILDVAGQVFIRRKNDGRRGGGSYLTSSGR
jgi:predicted O-methyltransferase YrrM